jgi:nitrogen-specific signal transduction histidine kinase
MAQETTVHLLQEDEISRLNALYQYEILDTPAEAGFDNITMLAAAIFGSQNAHICFVDENHVFYKANSGSSNARTSPRENNLDAWSIHHQDITIFNKERKFAKEIGFYIASPLINAEGFVLGTLAVSDTKPHEEITAQQLNMLQMLTSLVMDKLETRLAEKRMAVTYNERLRTLAHDIKNPVTSISLYAQLLSSKEMNKEKVFSMAERIENSNKRIEEKLNNLFI